MKILKKIIDLIRLDEYDSAESRYKEFCEQSGIDVFPGFKKFKKRYILSRMHEVKIELLDLLKKIKLQQASDKYNIYCEKFELNWFPEFESFLFKKWKIFLNHEIKYLIDHDELSKAKSYNLKCKHLLGDDNYNKYKLIIDKKIFKKYSLVVENYIGKGQLESAESFLKK